MRKKIFQIFLENKDVELLKKKKNTFEDIDEKKEINEQSEEDDDYSESGENISRNYYGFKPKYI